MNPDRFIPDRTNQKPTDKYFLSSLQESKHQSLYNRCLQTLLFPNSSRVERCVMMTQSSNPIHLPLSTMYSSSSSSSRSKNKRIKGINSTPIRVLDAPRLQELYQVFSVQGSWMALALSSDCYIWNKLNSNAECVYSLMEDEMIQMVQLSQDGRAVGVCTHDVAELLDLEHRQLLYSAPCQGITSQTIRLEDNQIALGTDSGDVFLYDVRQNHQHYSRLTLNPDHPHSITSIATNDKNKNMIAIADDHGQLSIYDTRSSTTCLVVHTIQQDEPHNPVAIQSLLYNPNDQVLAVIAADGIVHFVEPNLKMSQKQLQTGHKSRSSLLWSPCNSELLVVAETMQLWSYRNQSLLWLKESSNMNNYHNTRMLGVGVFADHTVATLHSNELVNFWNVFQQPAPKVKSRQYHEVIYRHVNQLLRTIR